MAAAAADADEEIDEAVYELIVACNEMVIDVEYEIDAIAKTVKDVYARRFPELDSLIPNPLDYARVVLKLGNEIELSEVDLTGILPSASRMPSASSGRRRSTAGPALGRRFGTVATAPAR